MTERLLKINRGLLMLMLAFCCGTLIGTLLWSGTVMAGAKLQPAPAERSAACQLLSLMWLPLAAVFLSTSVLGHRLLPLLLLLRGYLLSSAFSILISCGQNLSEAFLMIGLPALFSVPAFFLLCEDAAASSRVLCLCSESSLARCCGYIQPARLLISGILLSAAAALQIYILPLIV